jgi:hypothetical protein
VAYYPCRFTDREEKCIALGEREESMAEVPVAGSSFVAEVKTSGQRLRLVATETGYGAAANIYSLTEMRWLGLPHFCLTLDVARRWAEWETREYLRTIGKLPVLRIKWIPTKPGNILG